VLREHRTQSLQRAVRLPRLAVHVGQGAHRAGEQGGIQQKTDDFGGRSSRHGAAELPENQHHACRGQELHAGPERGVDQALLVAQVQDALDLAAITRRLQRLAREGLDGRQHAEVFLGNGD
jgi:hypothetical protein